MQPLPRVLIAAGQPQTAEPGNNLTQQVCTARGVLLHTKFVRKKKGKILDGATGKCSNNVAELNPGAFRCEHFKASCLCCCESCQTSLALFGELLVILTFWSLLPAPSWPAKIIPK